MPIFLNPSFENEKKLQENLKTALPFAKEETSQKEIVHCGRIYNRRNYQKGALGALGWILYRIGEAIKGIFGKSDWQKTERLITNKIIEKLDNNNVENSTVNNIAHSILKKIIEICSKSDLPKNFPKLSTELEELLKDIDKKEKEEIQSKIRKVSLDPSKIHEYQSPEAVKIFKHTSKELQKKLLLENINYFENASTDAQNEFITEQLTLNFELNKNKFYSRNKSFQEKYLLEAGVTIKKKIIEDKREYIAFLKEEEQVIFFNENAKLRLYQLSNASENVQKKVIQKYPEELSSASEIISNNAQFVWQLIEENKENNLFIVTGSTQLTTKSLGSEYLIHAVPEEVQEKILLEHANYKLMNYSRPKFKEDKNFVLKLVKEKGHIEAFAGAKDNVQKEIINENSKMLQYATHWVQVDLFIKNPELYKDQLPLFPENTQITIFIQDGKIRNKYLNKNINESVHTAVKKHLQEAQKK